MARTHLRLCQHDVPTLAMDRDVAPYTRLSRPIRDRCMPRGMLHWPASHPRDAATPVFSADPRWSRRPNSSVYFRALSFAIHPSPVHGAAASGATGSTGPVYERAGAREACQSAGIPGRDHRAWQSAMDLGGEFFSYKRASGVSCSGASWARGPVLVNAM
jgi:hypothetical protein